MGLTSRLSLHKPDSNTEIFGDYFIAYYAADLQKLDDEAQIRNLDAAGNLPVYDENGFLVDSGIAPADLEIGLLDSILTTRGMMLFRGASALQALSPDTDGKSLITKGAGANPIFGYPSHATLTDLTTGDPHTQYYNEARGDARYALLAKGVDNGNSHDHAGGDGAAIVAAAMSLSATARILGRKTAGSGAGEECTLSEILDFIGSAARGDLLYRGASGWLRLAKGTSGQALVMGADDPGWVARAWPASFVFGDGSDIVLAQEMGVGPFPNACKITEVKIREQALISSSATITLHIHDYNAAIGSAVDTFSLSGATYSETGLSWAVAAGKFVTVKVASPVSAKELSVGLVFEAT